MTLGWLVAAVFGQTMLGGFLAMLVIVSACSMDGISKLAPMHSRILNLSIFALPSSALLSIVMLCYDYRHGGGLWSWCWQAVPVVAAALYLVYAWRLGRRIAVLDTLEQPAPSPNKQGNANEHAESVSGTTG